MVNKPEGYPGTFRTVERLIRSKRDLGRFVQDFWRGRCDELRVDLYFGNSPDHDPIRATRAIVYGCLEKRGDMPDAMRDAIDALNDPELIEKSIYPELASFPIERYERSWLEVFQAMRVRPGDFERWRQARREEDKNRKGALPRPRPPIANVEAWYRESYRPKCKAEGIIPSREDDWIEALNALPNVSREQVRQARRKYAPDEWTKPGRRKTGTKAKEQLRP